MWYRLLIGDQPPEALHRHGELDGIHQVRNKDIRAIITRALHPDVDKRFRNAGEMLSAVDRVRERPGTQSLHVAKPVWLSVAAAVVLLAAIGLAQGWLPSVLPSSLFGTPASTSASILPEDEKKPEGSDTRSEDTEPKKPAAGGLAGTLPGGVSEPGEGSGQPLVSDPAPASGTTRPDLQTPSSETTLPPPEDQPLPSDALPLSTEPSPDGFYDALSHALDHPATVEVLDLSNQQLTDLPDTFGEFTNLRVLTLAHNRLRQIPASIGRLKKLEMLNLQYNELNGLPTWLNELTGVRRINASANPIQDVPDGLGGLPRLEKLLLDKTEISDPTFNRLVAELGASRVSARL